MDQFITHVPVKTFPCVAFLKTARKAKLNLSFNSEIRVLDRFRNQITNGDTLINFDTWSFFKGYLKSILNEFLDLFENFVNESKWPFGWHFRWIKGDQILSCYQKIEEFVQVFVTNLFDPDHFVNLVMNKFLNLFRRKISSLFVLINKW